MEAIPNQVPSKRRKTFIAGLKSCLIWLIAAILILACAYFLFHEYMYSKGLFGSGGPLSDNFGPLVGAIERYAEDHGGRLPEADAFFDELKPYVDTERQLYADFQEEPSKRFKAIPWEDEYGRGLLIYWSERDFGVPWRESFSHGLVVYEGVETGRVVLLLRTPDEPDFAEKWIRPMRLGAPGLDEPKAARVAE